MSGDRAGARKRVDLGLAVRTLQRPTQGIRGLRHPKPDQPVRLRFRVVFGLGS